jgi:hypothetical protein
MRSFALPSVSSSTVHLPSFLANVNGGELAWVTTTEATLALSNASSVLSRKSFAFLASEVETWSPTVKIGPAVAALDVDLLLVRLGGGAAEQKLALAPVLADQEGRGRARRREPVLGVGRYLRLVDEVGRPQRAQGREKTPHLCGIGLRGDRLGERPGGAFLVQDQLGLGAALEADLLDRILLKGEHGLVAQILQLFLDAALEGRGGEQDGALIAATRICRVSDGGGLPDGERGHLGAVLERHRHDRRGLLEPERARLAGLSSTVFLSSASATAPISPVTAT